MSYSAISAVASVGALIAAAFTVWQARAAGREAMTLQRQMLEAYTELLQATRTAHEEEMAERQLGRRADLIQQRIVQSQEVAQLLGTLTDVAREEIVTAPPTTGHPIQPMPLSRLPTLLFRLGVSLELLEALGGPPMPIAAELVRAGYGRRDQPVRVLGAANTALQELDHALVSDPDLQRLGGL